MAKLLVFVLFTTVILTVKSHPTQITDIEAPKNQFPYQVAIFVYRPETNIFCGGALISSEWILTTANCLYRAIGVAVYLGAHDIQGTEKERILMYVKESNLVVHEKWTGVLNENNIGLIMLPHAIKFKDNIRPILLPRQKDILKSFVDEDVISSGWGQGHDAASSVLRYMNLTVWPSSDCNIPYVDFPTDKNICAHDDYMNPPCRRDQGGPLKAFESDGTEILIGVTSFFIPMESDYRCWGPAIFTRVTFYLPWIHKHTGIELR